MEFIETIFIYFSTVVLILGLLLLLLLAYRPKPANYFVQASGNPLRNNFIPQEDWEYINKSSQQKLCGVKESKPSPIKVPKITDKDLIVAPELAGNIAYKIDVLYNDIIVWSKEYPKGINYQSSWKNFAISKGLDVLKRIDWSSNLSIEDQIKELNKSTSERVLKPGEAVFFSGGSRRSKEEILSSKSGVDMLTG